jgi:hypothetical protein
LLRRNKPESGMIDDVGYSNGYERNERQFASWRVVISAWVLVVIFVMLLTGATAVACLHSGPHHHRHLTGAVIPAHNPCSGPEIASAPGRNGCENLPAYEDRSAYW